MVSKWLSTRPIKFQVPHIRFFLIPRNIKYLSPSFLERLPFKLVVFPKLI